MRPVGVTAPVTGLKLFLNYTVIGLSAANEGVEVRLEVESPATNFDARRPPAFERPHGQRLRGMTEVSGGIRSAHSAIRKYPHLHALDGIVRRR